MLSWYLEGSKNKKKKKKQINNQEKSKKKPESKSTTRQSVKQINSPKRANLMDCEAWWPKLPPLHPLLPPPLRKYIQQKSAARQKNNRVSFMGHTKRIWETFAWPIDTFSPRIMTAKILKQMIRFRRRRNFPHFIYIYTLFRYFWPPNCRRVCLYRKKKETKTI